MIQSISSCEENLQNDLKMTYTDEGDEYSMAD